MVTIGRRIINPARPEARTASIVAPMPARYTAPPIGGNRTRAGATPRTLTSAAPVATRPTAVTRRRAGAGRPAVSAATKNGMTPEIAVDAPPARARWSGSQGRILVLPAARAVAEAAAATR